MAGWFPLSPWELAELAAVPDEGPLLIEQVGNLALWLREPAYREVGARVLAERRSADALPDTVLDALRRTAGQLARATYVSAVDLELTPAPGLTLITVVSDSGAAQVAARPGGCALRSIAWPLDQAELTTDLLALIGSDELVALSALHVVGGAEAAALRWDGTVLEGAAGVLDPDVEPDDALRTAVAFAAGAGVVAR